MDLFDVNVEFAIRLPGKQVLIFPLTQDGPGALTGLGSAGGAAWSPARAKRLRPSLN